MNALPDSKHKSSEDTIRIFVSYSRADIRWVIRGDDLGHDGLKHTLIPWLQEQIKNERAEIWSDPKLKDAPSEDFAQRIQKEIALADIALLLLSEEFATSDFIQQEELPPIKQRHDNGDLSVLSILVGPITKQGRQKIMWLFRPTVLPSDVHPLLNFCSDEAAFRTKRIEILEAIRNTIETIRTGREVPAQSESHELPKTLDSQQTAAPVPSVSVGSFNEKPSSTAEARMRIAAGVAADEFHHQLYIAVARSEVNTVEAILREYPDLVHRKASSDGGTLLIHAAFHGQANMAKFLIALGVDVNAKDRCGETAMHVAAWRWNNPDVAQVLIENGADVMATNNLGITPLHKAVMLYGGKVPSAKFLLEHGAHVNSEDAEGFTPLHHAVVAPNDRESAVEMVALLLEKGADPNAKNKEGKTVLQLALERKSNNLNKVIYLLQEYGAKDQSDKPVSVPTQTETKPVLPGSAASGNDVEQQKRLFVISTGISENMTLFSAPGFTKDIGSIKVGQVGVGATVDVLETRDDNRCKWYRVRVLGGQEGWIAEDTGNFSQFQVEGDDPRIFCTVEVKTSGGERLFEGYLKQVTQMPKYSIVQPDDIIEAEDGVLGTIKIRWGDMKSVEMKQDVVKIRTITGNAYVTAGPFGLQTRISKGRAFWEKEDHVNILTTTLWLVTPDTEIKIAGLKDATLLPRQRQTKR